MASAASLRILRASCASSGLGHGLRVGSGSGSGFGPGSGYAFAAAAPCLRPGLSVRPARPPLYHLSPGLRHASSVTAPVLAADAANPPSTTRPPPLHLPERAPDSSAFAHLLATGKAYLAFYKTGLHYLWANYQLVRSPDAAATRAHLQLRHRWQHDLRRLPIFGLLLIVCGELTPLVVLVFPHLVPGPCRIPKQVDKLQRLAEDRRSASFALVAARPPADPVQEDADADAYAHVARSLGLVSPLWDRIGWVPAGLARWSAARRLRYLAEDDALLRQSGGAPALIPEEVVLACVDRGLDVRGLPVELLRDRLAVWLQLSASAATKDTVATADSDPAMQRRIALLRVRPEEWSEPERYKRKER